MSKPQLSDPYNNFKIIVQYNQFGKVEAELHQVSNREEHIFLNPQNNTQRKSVSTQKCMKIAFLRKIASDKTI